MTDPQIAEIARESELPRAPLTPLERELCEALQSFCAPIATMDSYGLGGSVPQHDREHYDLFRDLLRKAKDRTNG